MKATILLFLVGLAAVAHCKTYFCGSRANFECEDKKNYPHSIGEKFCARVPPDNSYVGHCAECGHKRLVCLHNATDAPLEKCPIKCTKQ